MEASIIGIPMDLGANRRGVDMGPSAIRYADLGKRLSAIGVKVADLGNIEVPIPEKENILNGGNRYANLIYDTCTELAKWTAEAAQMGKIPLILGGDHSIAIGSLAGMRQACGDLGVIWFDAHADLNTFATSPSGNVHGMPLAFSMGLGDHKLNGCLRPGPKVKPENTVLIGIRDLDPGEKEVIKEQGIKVFTMYDVDKMGMGRVMEEAISIITEGTEGVHISFDMDVLDPIEAPGVGTPVTGGINYREAHLALELLAEQKALKSMEVVEVNPILDTKNQTANLAVELIVSAFGKRVF